MHQFYHFDRESFSRVNIQRLIDVPSCPVSQLLPNLPFDRLAEEFLALCCWLDWKLHQVGLSLS